MSTQLVEAAPQAAKLPAALAVAVAGEQQQYLTFSLNEEMFAIGILAIREIIEYGSLTEVPMTPPFIRGVINLRGAVVPVIDLSVRFGRNANETTKRTCIVIIETETDGGQHHQMGVVVDAVSEVLEIPAADIEPPRVRRSYPHRLHLRHGQGQRQVRRHARRQPQPPVSKPSIESLGRER
jgi:purine-binding chemotaxis protein CheW